MKSMLHEASSVIKAIEKAWEDSGKPKEFTVTVLEQGEKNFLGFTKRPAVVSMTYDPNRQETRNGLRTFYQRDRKDQRRDVHVAPAQKNNRISLGESQQKQSANLNRQQKNPVEQQVRTNVPQQDQQDNAIWTTEWADLVSGWLKDILVTMGMDSTAFTYKIDRKVLTITFEKNLLDHPDEERAMFISFSYLLIQFLKKKFKKKFRGFHLLIHSKARQSYDKQGTTGA